jgi:hypothetical protein
MGPVQLASDDAGFLLREDFAKVPSSMINKTLGTLN